MQAIVPVTNLSMTNYRLAEQAVREAAQTWPDRIYLVHVFATITTVEELPALEAVHKALKAESREKLKTWQRRLSALVANIAPLEILSLPTPTASPSLTFKTNARPVYIGASDAPITREAIASILRVLWTSSPIDNSHPVPAHPIFSQS